MSSAVAKILKELKAHPKDKEGFYKGDFDSLTEHERSMLVEPFMADLMNGDSTAVEPLQWLLRERYVAELESRLENLSPDSPGLLFLPHWLYEATGDRAYLGRMMAEIVRARPGWDRRRHALGGYLRKSIGSEPLFWDFCRYLVLNDPDAAMKKTALLWLAKEKKYPLIDLALDDPLSRCLIGMGAPGGPTPEALAILNSLHTDTGSSVV